MDVISDEFILARTGEHLESKIREDDKFQQQIKSLHKASSAFSKGSGMSKKCWKLQGEDEMFECLTNILDNSEITPEERAKMLTEFGKA